MAPLRHIRRSRRLSHKSPVELPDYDWQGVASLQLLHSGPDVEIAPSTVHRHPPSPSASTTTTTTTTNSPSSILTYLPFTPGSSHTRNRKEGHIPRPPNAFMIFRSWLWNNDNLKNIERDNRNVSRIAGRYWNELSEAERAPFRYMADEAKARHAQLYPQYRYSPTSQKKPKASQRRTQRSTDAENEKCKKVADMLLDGVTGRDLAKYLGEGHKNVKSEEGAFVPVAEGTSSGSFGAVLRNDQRLITPQSPAPPGFKKQNALLSLHPASYPPSQYSAPLPIIPAAAESAEATPVRGALPHTPELVYPPRQNDLEGFIATNDIPYLSLDNYNDLMVRKSEDDDIIPALLPSHLKPGAGTVFSGVKPEATSFVDSCILGAHTTDALVLPSPVSFADFEIESYPALVPLGSPVFTNPFEPSTPIPGHLELLGTLDQLFGQSISPLTPVFPTENW